MIKPKNKNPHTPAESCHKPLSGSWSPSFSGSERRTSIRAPWAHPGCSSPWRSCPPPAGATGRRCAPAGERLYPAAAPHRSLGNCVNHKRVEGKLSFSCSETRLTVSLWSKPQFNTKTNGVWMLTAAGGVQTWIQVFCYIPTDSIQNLFFWNISLVQNL